MFLYYDDDDDVCGSGLFGCVFEQKKMEFGGERSGLLTPPPLPSPPHPAVLSETLNPFIY